MMLSRTTALAAMALTLVSAGQARAASYPPFYVYGESETDDHATCKVSYASTIAAAKSELRAKRATLDETSSPAASDAVDVYISLEATPINNGDGFTGACALMLQVALQSNLAIDNPVNNVRHFVTAEYCHVGSTLVWSANTAQSQVSQTVRAKIDDCLAEYTESIMDN